MSSIIFGPLRLLGNAHLFNWLFRWPVGADICLLYTSDAADE